ncbi:MAG: ComEC/Rec2 family competence protein [Eubacteriales bacterium]
MLKNRLLSVGVLLFALTISILVYADGWIIPLCFVLLTVSCCVYGAIRFLYVKTAFIFAFIPLVAFVYFNIYTLLFVPAANPGESGSVTGVVSSASSYFSGQSLEIKVVYSDIIPKGTRIRVYADVDTGFALGDAVTVKGGFYPAREKPNLLAAGIKYYSYGDVSFITKSEGLITKLRNRISSVCDDFFPSDIAAFVKAITVGDSSSISLSDYAAYSSAGIAHVLAVSGLHLSILVLSLYNLIRKLTRNGIVLAVCGVAFCILVSAMTGFSYSALRSAIMLSVFFIGRAAGRNSDSVTSLFAALFVLLILNPYSVASLSLQLSFLSALGIIVFSNIKPFSKGVKTPGKSFLINYIYTPVMFSVSSFVFTLPVLVFALDRLSIISPVANIIAALMFPAILILSCIFALMAFITPFLALPAAFGVKWLARIFIAVCKFLAGLPFSFISTHTPFISAGVVLCVCLIATSLIAGKKPRKIIIPISAFSMVLVVAASIIAQNSVKSNTCRIIYRDTLKGFAVYVSGNEGSVFIDYGSASLGDDLVFLSGDTECDVLIFTKYDEFSLKKAEYFASCMKTKKIYLKEPENEAESSLFRQITLLANDKGCDIIKFDTFSVNLGNAYAVGKDSLLVGTYSTKAVIPLVNDEGLFDMDESYNVVFLPTMLYGRNFDLLPRTRHILYGYLTNVANAERYPYAMEYTYYDPVAVTITDGGNIEVEQWH